MGLPQGRRLRSSRTADIFALWRSERQPAFPPHAQKSSSRAAGHRWRAPSFARGSNSFCALFVTTFALLAQRSWAPKQIRSRSRSASSTKPMVARRSPSSISPQRTTSSPAREWRWTTTTPPAASLIESFSILDSKLAPGGLRIAPLNEMLADGVRFFIVDLPAAEVLAVADAARAEGALVFMPARPTTVCAKRIVARM